MKIKERFNHWIPKLLGVNAIVLYPFVLYRPVNPSEELKRHEMVHVKQIQKVGVIRFYLSYLTYNLAGMIQGKSFFRAYYDNPYEVEARKAEKPITCGFCKTPCGNDWCVSKR